MSEKAPRYDDTPVGLIVFMCHLGKCILNLSQIALNLPVTQLNKPPTFKDGKMRLPVDDEMFPGTIASMVFIDRQLGFIRRGTLTGNEKCFKPDRTIECRLYSHHGRGLTVKISNTNIHVTAAKDEKEDVDAVSCLIDSIIYCNDIIQRITCNNPTLVWFKTVSKLKEHVICYEGNESFWTNIATQIPDTPEGLDDEMVDYFIRLSKEYDDHDCFVSKLDSLCGDIRLFDIEEPYISRFQMVNKSKWMTHGWIPNQNILYSIFSEIEDYEVVRACMMNKPLTMTYKYRNENVEIDKVTLFFKSTKFSISGKSDDVLRKAANTYLDIAERFRPILEMKLKDVS